VWHAHLKFYSICSSFVFSCLFILFYFNPNGSDSQQCRHHVNCVNHDFYKRKFLLKNLPLFNVFQAHLCLWDFFQLSSICPFHLKIGTCSFNNMLNKNFNSHTSWNSQNLDNPRLILKQGLWAGSRKKIQHPTL
jgi:hypothetical protein